MNTTPPGNPIALVTGAIGGLGTAIGEKMHDLGYTVYANFHPAEQEKAEVWQQQQQAAERSFQIIAADISRFEDCEQMAETIQQQGALSVLVNNAGITRDSTLRKMELHQWQSVIDTNLSGLFNVSRQFVSGMCDAGFGRIINIASVNGQRGQFGQTNYSAAKAGVHGFSMALAQETARYGVTVNSISPGFIQTDMVDAIPTELRQGIIDSIPAGRVGQPEDIARAVAFLAAPESSYITGVNLPVNGGIFMH